MNDEQNLKDQEQKSTKKALETGLVAAANIAGGPVAGKAAKIIKHLPTTKMALNLSAKRVNSIPGAGKVTKTLDDIGAIDAAGKVLNAPSSNNSANIASDSQINDNLDSNDYDEEAETPVLVNATQNGDGKSGGFFSSLITRGIEEAWRNLPFTLKLKIVGITALVLVAVLFLVAIISFFNFNFLDYSKDTSSSGNVPSEYSEYWYQLCSEEDSECTDEEIERAKKLQDSQERFYKRLNSLASSYKLSEEQKYLVLTTIFYEYEIDDFIDGSSAYNLDVEGNDNVNETVDTSADAYQAEYDTLKELIKQFKAYNLICTVTYTTETGEASTNSYAIKDANGKEFNINWFEYALALLGKETDSTRGYNEAVASCPGTVTRTETRSNEAYYRYLIESDFFDKRVQLKSHYQSYADTYGLDADNIASWPDADKIAVRTNILDFIKEIVSEYMEESGNFIAAVSGKSYWWPIGSLATSDVDGVLYAADIPQFTGINSPFGMRFHPVHNEYRLHNGVDLQGNLNETNVIASLGGTVLKINNTCASTNSAGCGGGAGNYIEILDTKGNVEVYMHIFRDSFLVSEGDIVSQGQVLAKVGSSGDSTGAHLHFTIKLNGVAVDPLDYIDPTNPRPTSVGLVDFNSSSFTREEFIATLTSYFSTDGICNSSSSQYVNGCTSFKNEVLNNNGAGVIYDVASSLNINPEIIVARSLLEGFSPGTGYNYFGYTCYNTGGIQACSQFATFRVAMETFFQNAAQYDSLESMMSRYAYLGDYWYTGIHWGWGGCAYASYIYPDGVPDRVQTACAHPDGYCSINSTANCTPTNQDDKDAYTQYQVKRMADVIAKVFG